MVVPQNVTRVFFLVVLMRDGAGVQMITAVIFVSTIAVSEILVLLLRIARDKDKTCISSITFKAKSELK